jgi:hypothetical protein
MKSTRFPSITAAAAVAAALGFAVLAISAGPVAAISPLSATITLKPNNVMVNTYTTVTGHHFLPHQTVSLRECSQTSWIAPQNPCDTNNGRTVTANSFGTFVTRMKVEACPRLAAGISEQCYIGVPKPTGIDTIELTPNAGIVVTFP